MTSSDIHVAEHEIAGVQSGRWGEITKEKYRDYDMERAVAIPLGAGIVALVAVGLPVVVVVWLFSNARYGLVAGCVAGSVAFGVTTLRSIEYARRGLAEAEYWESEAVHLGAARAGAVRQQATTEPVRIEVWSQNEMGYPRIVYDEIGISRELLQMIAAPEMQFSKRRLMALGVEDTEAMRLVARLLELGYTERSASNVAATWTEKGLALCRAVGGGGGGGMTPALVDVCEESQEGRADV